VSRKNLHRTGGWHEKDALPFYGSHECARAIAVSNGVDTQRWHAVEPTQDAVEAALGPGSADMVMSLLSMGFHYPVSTYAKAIRAVLKPRVGRLMVTFRPSHAPRELLTLTGLGFACANQTVHGGAGGREVQDLVVATCTVPSS
jgi:hypothetical protein